MSKIEKFFVVWSPGRGVPVVRHPSFNVAKDEARRLAKQQPGDEFFVLAAIGRAQLPDPVDWAQTFDA